jgi:hypothetical protein
LFFRYIATVNVNDAAHQRLPIAALHSKQIRT